MNTIQIGVDEVGRGCVFGPLVVCSFAVIPGQKRIELCTDSKTIKSEKKRQQICDQLLPTSYYITASAPAVAIDRFGIARTLSTTTETAIAELVVKLNVLHPNNPMEIVLDGIGWQEMIDRMKPSHPHLTFRFEPKADANVYECSGASIVAKVTRDNWCHEMVRINPNLKRYDIQNNFGYGTPKHLKGLQMYGMTEHHRKDFCSTLLKNAHNKLHGTSTPK